MTIFEVKKREMVLQIFKYRYMYILCFTRIANTASWVLNHSVVKILSSKNILMKHVYSKYIIPFGFQLKQLTEKSVPIDSVPDRRPIGALIHSDVYKYLTLQKYMSVESANLIVLL